MTRRRLVTSIAVLAFAVASAALFAAVTTSASARSPMREFRGKIVSVDRSHHVFRLQNTRGGMVRFHVYRGTHYSYCDWDGMHAGIRADVHARNSGGRWVASRIERWHGGWSHDRWDDHDGWGHRQMHDSMHDWMHGR